MPRKLTLLRPSSKARVMLVQPWNYHDEGVANHDFSMEWRNGPYSLLLLAAVLKKHNHQVIIADLSRKLVEYNGDLTVCLEHFSDHIIQFKPDIIGFSFFSVHYNEVKRALTVARETCRKNGLHPLFIAGGIHASVEPERTVADLGFDYSFVGEADVGIVKLAEGRKPETIPGVHPSAIKASSRGEVVKNLDTLPFPDWSLCDYRFYAQPSCARIKIRQSRTLDMMMGRGCINRCSFCAYSSFSKLRYYSPSYLVEQVRFMQKEYQAKGIYFLDSTVGNNRKLLWDFCELLLQKELTGDFEWLANMRPDQADEELLRLMWRSGCRFLFYGFESGSQRILDMMNKNTTVDQNYRTAELHNKLKFPYNASMIVNFPGEQEGDIIQTIEFLKKTKPPSIGINWYVPLPGSPDYRKLKMSGVIGENDHLVWREIGESNSNRLYADIPEKRFRELIPALETLAYVEIPGQIQNEWK